MLIIGLAGSGSGVIVALVAFEAWLGSLDTKGSGVSSCEVSLLAGGGAKEARGFLLRFLGTAFEGEAARLLLSRAGVNICVGLADSITRARHIAAGLGITSAS